MQDGASTPAGTEAHYLKSDHVGDGFKVFVAHCGSWPDQTAQPLPPTHVGIGYRRGGLADTMDWRSRDFSPSADQDFLRVYPDCPHVGGVSRFVDFIRDELMP